MPNLAASAGSNRDQKEKSRVSDWYVETKVTIKRNFCSFKKKVPLFRKFEALLKSSIKDIEEKMQGVDPTH